MLGALYRGEAGTRVQVPARLAGPIQAQLIVLLARDQVFDEDGWSCKGDHDHDSRSFRRTTCDASEVRGDESCGERKEGGSR